MRLYDTDINFEEERIKLFNEVWKEPMVTVAKRYGLSDNGLRKRCVKLEIPLPPVGYWAKLEAGKNVVLQPKLPPLKSNQHNVGDKYSHIIKYIDHTILTNQKLRELDGLDLLTEESKERFLSLCKNIRVPKSVDQYNSLINKYQNEITYRKQRDEEHQFRDLFSLNIMMQLSRSNISYRKNNAVLAISVSNKQTTRALNIMETLIRLVNELDGSVVVQPGEHDNTSCRLFEKSFTIQLTEIMVKRRSLLPKPESEDLAANLKPMYEKVPSGMLDIEFKEPQNHCTLRIVDSAETTIEKQLGEIFTELFKTSVKSKIEEIITDREYKEKTKEQRSLREIEENNKKMLEEIERQAKEFEELNKRKQRLSQNIENQMENWNKSRELHKFAEELEAYTTYICDKAKKELLTAYIILIREKANKCDPIADILNEVKGTISLME